MDLETRSEPLAVVGTCLLLAVYGNAVILFAFAILGLLARFFLFMKNVTPGTTLAATGASSPLLSLP